MNILIIAGFDPTGGAGLQADLKTVTLLGETGLTVATALTVQDTTGVKNWVAVDKSVLSAQLEALVEDIRIDAVKIGMIPDSETVEIIVQQLERIKPKCVVIDPVIKAKNAFVLTPAWEEISKRLFPLASLITPNREEAGVFWGKVPRDEAEMKEAAKELFNLGSKAVLITGGDLDKPVDVLFDGQDFYFWKVEKKQTKPVHGTGCVYSSAITTFLAKGYSLTEAITQAKRFITLAVDGAIGVGKGSLLSNPCAHIKQQLARYEVIEALKGALKRLQAVKEVAKLIPEVRSNLVYALPYARDYQEVAGFPGRLTVVEDRVCACALPAFGVSRHMASVVLKAMEYDQNMRAAMNIKYLPVVIEKGQNLGYKIKEVSRTEEAPETKQIEGKTLPWLTEQAVREDIPDLIYDKGDVGKEPMIRVLGKNPADVIDKVISLAKEVFKDG